MQIFLFQAFQNRLTMHRNSLDKATYSSSNVDKDWVQSNIPFVSSTAMFEPSIQPITQKFESHNNVLNTYSITDFIDFMDLDGSSTTSDDWLCNDITLETSSDSFLEDCCSLDLPSPSQTKVYKHSFIENPTTNDSSSSKELCYVWPEYLTSTKSIMPPIQNSRCANDFHKSSVNEFVNMSNYKALGNHVNFDASTFWTPKHFERYFSSLGLSTNEQNSQHKEQVRISPEKQQEFLSESDLENVLCETDAITGNVEENKLVSSNYSKELIQDRCGALESDLVCFNAPMDSHRTDDISSEVLKFQKEINGTTELLIADDDLNRVMSENTFLTGKFSFK